MTYTFKHTIEQLIKDKTISYDEDLGITRGLSSSKGLKIINLSANQWKKAVNKDHLIEEISKTDVHEHVHLLIWENAVGIYTSEGEERVCEILAGETMPDISVLF